MKSKKKNGILISMLLTTLIMLTIFAVVLVLLNKKGYLSFKQDNNVISNNKSATVSDKNAVNTDDSIARFSQDSTKTENNNESENIISSSTNMSAEEVFEFWNKIKGNWANIKYINDLCVGQSIAINTYVTISKFNSDGITRWSILSFEKVDKNNYKINLVAPVNLNDQMAGDIVARYNTISIDISNLKNKKINISFYGNNFEYEYVGENKLVYNESTHYQYVDGGFNQDYYCKWYNENH